MEKEREKETEEEEEREILLPYELEFSDLLLLSSVEHSSSSLAPDEIERRELITRTIMENLGPTGPGLIAITGVPIASTLRRTLLPLARELALLNFEDRKRVLKLVEIGFEDDVEDASTITRKKKILNCRCGVGGVQDHAGLARKALVGKWRAASLLWTKDNNARVVEFECKNKRDREMWTKGVSRLLSIASETKNGRENEPKQLSCATRV